MQGKDNSVRSKCVSIHKDRMVQHFLFGLGSLSLALGIIGIFLPLLPTTPFLILTAWCFLKSSPKAHAWMYRQAYMGQVLRDWEARGAIRPRAKFTAIAMLAGSTLIMWWIVQIFWLKVAVSCLLAAVSVFILTRPAS